MLRNTSIIYNSNSSVLIRNNAILPGPTWVDVHVLSSLWGEGLGKLPNDATASRQNTHKILSQKGAWFRL